MRLSSKIALIPLLMVRWLAVILIIFLAARSLYYPFWAASASEDQLQRSWGGPHPVGATVVHWLVAAVMAAACLGVITVSRGAERRLRNAR